VDLATDRPVRLRGVGRFDLNFAPRVAVIAEAMTALVLVDACIEAGFLHPCIAPGAGTNAPARAPESDG
jgi:chorismate synthase